MAVSEIIKMLELLTLFNKKDDIEKIQKVIRDIITSLEKQARVLDFILWYSYGLMLYIFYKTVIKKVVKK